MLKKYFSFIVLVVAAVMYWYIKTKQRGHKQKHTTEHIQVMPGGEEPFTRDTSAIVYSKHALCRMDCRHINEWEVKEIILKGKINYDKIEEDNRGITYPLEGVTQDKQFIRVVVAPKENSIVIVTVVDLDTNWTCNCK
ncbi:MAG TPA: DUF4258 domain-containing protein [Ferruginibacter sp.]|nr:DUF4258 domain-containing protein [Ferruginibacter sp.]HMP20383.1 DUF4258 domain-containing protein [Ferruginibacter sp.]